MEKRTKGKRREQVKKKRANKKKKGGKASKENYRITLSRGGSQRGKESEERRERERALLMLGLDCQN